MDRATALVPVLVGDVDETVKVLPCDQMWNTTSTTTLEYEFYLW